MSEIILKHTDTAAVITPTVEKSKVYLDKDTKLLASRDDDGTVVIYTGGSVFVPFDITISTPGYQTLITYPLQTGSSRFQLYVVTNQDDNLERALFRRVALLYVPPHCGLPGQAFLQGPYWETTETFKSNSNIDIKYMLIGPSIVIQVRNAGVAPMRWMGHTSIITSN